MTGCEDDGLFLTEEFIRRYFPMAELPPAELNGCLEFAARIRQDSLLRQTALSLYRNYLAKSSLHGEEVDGFGPETGLLNLLLALGLIPAIEMRMRQDRIPIDYARAAARRIGALRFSFGQLCPERFGIRTRSLPFLLNYKNEPMFRIGRFDFLLIRNNDVLPEIYHKNGEVIAWSRDEWLLDSAGHRIAEPAESDCRRGRRRINLERGLAEIGDDIFPDDLKPAVKDDDWGLFFHIPGGEPMTLPYCIESFADALIFFRKHYPEKPIQFIYSNSWIFNPAWLEYIPQGNLAALIRHGHLFPAISTGREGLYFVFGRDDGTIDDYQAVNSMQRAMLRCWRDYGTLERFGFFLLPDEIAVK